MHKNSLNAFNNAVIPSGARDLTVEAGNTLSRLCGQSTYERSFNSFRMTPRTLILYL